MIYVLISIVCNTLLFVILRFFPRYGIITLHGIVANYFTAAALGFLLDQRPTRVAELPQREWFVSALILGALFISIFLLLARTAQTIGVSVASVANKMSVIIPVIVSFLFFSEAVTVLKITGIVLALAAVWFVSKKEGDKSHGKNSLLLPFIVFLGSGAIDALVSFASKKQLLEGESSIFVSVCFTVAGTIGLAVILFRWKPVALRSILGGIILGIPNYFSIYTIMKALDGNAEASVIYPVVNVGVVLLSALAGLFIFSERFSKMNRVGIALAVLAIAMIACSDILA